MHRSRLITACFIIAFAACKKEESAPVQQASAPLERAAAPAASTVAPTGIVYAASTHLRLVDPARGVVAASIDLGKAIQAIAFSADGSAAFVASSGGVFQVDTKARAIAGQLTSSPARNVSIADGGKKIYVLEHDVVVEENGTRDIKPYRVKTIEIATGKVLATEEIGQQILFALPSENGRSHVVVNEGGDVLVGAPNEAIADGHFLKLGNAPLRVRGNVVAFGGHAYVPVEGQPARVVDIDLASGEAKPIELEASLLIRGLGVTPDGKTLVVNAVKQLVLVDRTGGKVTGRLELSDPHQGVAISADGKFVYLAQTIDGTGGAVGIVELSPLAFRGKVHLDDISPWAIAAAP